jgi:hypothetical protein
MVNYIVNYLTITLPAIVVGLCLLLILRTQMMELLETFPLACKKAAEEVPAAIVSLLMKWVFSPLFWAVLVPFVIVMNILSAIMCYWFQVSNPLLYLYCVTSGMLCLVLVAKNTVAYRKVYNAFQKQEHKLNAI